MKQVRFDARQFQYIGAPYAEATVLVVTRNSGITSNLPLT